MKNAIIVHGSPSEAEYLSGDFPSPSNSHWLPWLQKNLLVNTIFAQTPEMPRPYDPTYEEWREVFEAFPVNGESTLIGHSSGAGFLVRWLSENQVKVKKLLLVAPWMDPEGKEFGSMFDFELDAVIPTRMDVEVLISHDDEISMLDTVSQLEAAWPGVAVHWFEDRGHFTLNSMGTDKFPELLEAALSD